MKFIQSRTLNLELGMFNNDTSIDNFNLTQKDVDFLKRLFLEQGLNKTTNNSEISNSQCDECSGIIQDIVLEYAETYHSYFAFAVCLFGTIANILNIAVLTRKDMACAPINRILTGLAVAEMMIMVEYMTFAYYYYIELPGKMNFPYAGAVFIMFHIHFTQVLHTISICFTVTLAIWRYVAIGFPDKNHIYCSEKRCTWAISLSYILPIILCSPTYFVLAIRSTRIMEDKELYILYHTSLSEIAIRNDSYLVFNFWMYAVVIKLLPCCILTVISCWLIKTLFTARKRKENLRNYNACVQDNKDKSKHKGERRADRTTKMLVAVLLLFLMTEFPQGIFALMIGMKGKCFFLKCYQNFGAIMDILALFNGSINFILYCCMNRNFRMHFGQLFKHQILAKWVPPVQSGVQSTFL